MGKPVLIYCADGNARYQKIAIDAGFLSGAQLPRTLYFPPYFVDQNWNKYQKALTESPQKAAIVKAQYMNAVAIHKPYMASVLDWEKADQLEEVLSWAEEIAQWVETVMLIPKVQGGIPKLPRTIGGKPVRLGYSVPTMHGGTALPYEAFRGWPVHLLGGSPHKQMSLTKYLNVVSADGNMHLKMAKSCRFWSQEKGPNGHWVNMYQVGDGGWGKDSNYEAFRRSCQNIMAAWNEIYSSKYFWN